MNKLLRLELKRALGSWKFLIVIVLGCVMAILAFIYTPGFTIATNWYKYMHGDEMAASIINKINMIDTPLEIWMPRYGASSTFYNTWITLLPVLTVIPYGIEYAREKKNGLINQYMIRINKGKYYASKFITTFISGGLVAVVPLIFNLLLVMCFLPWGMPIRSSNLYPVVDNNVLNDVFYNTPSLYVLIYLVYVFVLFGLISCICLSFVYIEENIFALTITPFIIYFSGHVLLTFGLGMVGISLMNNASLYNTFSNNVGALLIQFAILLVADLAFFYRVRRDVI
ncbi:MAG: hypothetical protein ACI4E1_10780 [Lachnospira sp.]